MKTKHEFNLQKISILLTLFSFLLLTPALFQHVGKAADEDVTLLIIVWIITGINIIIRTRYLPKNVDETQ
jgi:uncharacterized membrane protein